MFRRFHKKFCILFTISLIIFLISGSQATAETLDVYPTMTRLEIQAVVDSASDGDTICFHPGIYDWGDALLPVRGENEGAITISEKSLTLKGESVALICGPDSIDGTGANPYGANAFHVIDLDIDNDVTFDNLNFQNFLRGIAVSYITHIPGRGYIAEPNARNITVKNCTFSDIHRDAISTSNVKGNILIQNNEMSAERMGMFIDWYWSENHEDWQPEDTHVQILGNEIYSFSQGVYLTMTTNAVVTDNEISGPMKHGIWVRYATNAVITNNTITGEMWRAIQFNRASNSVISNNMIDRVISPPWHKWWNGAIATDYSINCTIQGNIICGEGRSAIHLWNTGDSIIINNDCSGYTASWGGTMIPKEEKGLCQMWFGRHSDGNRVSGNIWGPVPSDAVAVVFVSAKEPSSNLDILDNDYRQCGVPGWASADGPGCVLLANGTQNSFVFESGKFPPGTGDAKKQVVDLTRELTGSSTNRVVGHPANLLVEDLNPGIGQRLQEIMDQLDALPESVEEEERQ